MDPIFRLLTLLGSVLAAALIVALTRGKFRVSQLWYDDFQLITQLEDRFPYLKRDAAADHKSAHYIGPRDYFDFEDVYSGIKSAQDLYANKSIEAHLYEELRAMEITSSIATMDQWHYSDELAHLREKHSPQRAAQCAAELSYLADELAQVSGNFSRLYEGRGLERAQFARWIDTWARPPSETYHGNSYWTGSYRGCEALQVPYRSQQVSGGGGGGGNSTAAAAAADSPRLRFRFCWLKLRPKSWPNEEEITPETSFRLGICVPKSCTSSAVAQQVRLVRQIMHFNFAPVHKDRFGAHTPRGVYCLPDHKEYLDAFALSNQTYIWAALALVWLLLVTYASLAPNTSNLLKCLSVQANLSRFWDDNEPRDGLGVDLRPAGVAKTVGSGIVVIGHTLMSAHWVFFASTININEYTKPKWTLLQYGFKTPDLFMVVGGMTSSYVLFSRLAAGRLVARQLIEPSFYLRMLLLRYLRLAPMLVLVLVFAKSVYPLLGAGPFWDYATYKYSIQGQCQRESWLRTLMPVVIPLDWAGQNPYFNECLAVSWYVLADLKLSLLAPLFVYLVERARRKTRTCVRLTLVCVLLSGAWHYKDLSMQRLLYLRNFLTYGHIYALNMLGCTFSESSYYAALSRLGAYASGLCAGYLLHRYNGSARRETRHKSPSCLTNNYLMLACALWYLHDSALGYLAGRSFRDQLERVHEGVDAPQSVSVASEQLLKWVAVVRTRLDAIAISLLLIRASTDWSKYIMRFASPMFKLSKLAYCVYLVHTLIIAHGLGAHERARPDSVPAEAWYLSWGYICTSFMIAFPLFVLVESPLKLLLDELLMAARGPTGAARPKSN